MIHWPSLGKALWEATKWTATTIVVIGLVAYGFWLGYHDPVKLVAILIIAGFIALVRCRYKKHSRKVSGM